MWYEMSQWLWVTAGILLIVILLGVLTGLAIIRRKKKTSQPPNYQALFAMGIVFLGAGIILTLTTENWGFIGMTALGFVYIITGLANADTWHKK
jgi:uncharacterized membrane protein